MNGVSLDIETDAPENPLMWECAERSLCNRGDDYGEDDCRRWLATSPVAADVRAVALWSGPPRPVRVFMRKNRVDGPAELDGVKTRDGVPVEVKLFASEWELLGTINGMLDDMGSDWPLWTYSGRTFDSPA